MASESVSGVFEEARERVRGEICSLVDSLNGKRDLLLGEIGTLEREYLDTQKQRQKDISKLNTLIAHTEELGENTLLNLQQRMIQEMRQEMDKLKLDSKQKPDYSIDIKWGYIKAVLIQSINTSKIVLITDPSADGSQESDATDSSEDDNSTGQVPLPCPSPDSDDLNCNTSEPEFEPLPGPNPQVIQYRTPEHRRRASRDTEECEERRPQSPDRASRGGYRDREFGQGGYEQSRANGFGQVGGYQRGGPRERPFQVRGFQGNNRGTRPPRRPTYRVHKQASGCYRQETDQVPSD